MITQKKKEEEHHDEEIDTNFNEKVQENLPVSEEISKLAEKEIKFEVSANAEGIYIYNIKK